MFLENFFGFLPWPIVDTLVRVVGFMGALAMGYAVLLEAEKRQDAVFVVGSASLFVYALWQGNYIFMFAMGLVFLVSARELIQIFRKKHLHTTEMVEKYKHPENE